MLGHRLGVRMQTRDGGCAKAKLQPGTAPAYFVQLVWFHIGTYARLGIPPCQTVAGPKAQGRTMSVVQANDLRLRAAQMPDFLGAGGTNIIGAANHLNHRRVAVGATKLPLHNAGHIRGKGIGIALALISQRAQKMVGAKLDRIFDISKSKQMAPKGRPRSCLFRRFQFETFFDHIGWFNRIIAREAGIAILRAVDFAAFGLTHCAVKPVK